MEAKTLEIVDVTEMAIIKVESLDPVALFTGSGIDPILKEIERQVSGLEYDLETAKGRKEIASTAHKVSKAKVLLDGLGKTLVADWKGKAKKVDATRKQAREFLDDLRDKVRKPLTDREEAETTRIAAEDAEKRRLVEEEIDRQDRELAEREAKLAEREAELKRKEDARLAKEKADKDEQDRKDREAKLKTEAADAAKKEAEENAAADRIAAEERVKAVAKLAAKAEQDRLEAIERAKRDKIAAEERAKRAAEQAEREKLQAIEAERVRAKGVADQKERDRITKEKADKIKADRDAANLNHRKRIDRETIEDIIEVLDISAAQAKIIVWSIAAGKVRNCTINY